MTEYKITEAAFVRASTYVLKKMRITLLVIALLIPLAGLVVLGWTQQALIAVALLYLILILFFTLLAPAINRWNYRRIYRNNPLLHKRQSVEISESGIRLWSENGESRYAFSEIKKIRLFPDMVLVYPTTTFYHLIPRSVLSEADYKIIEKHSSSV